MLTTTTFTITPLPSVEADAIRGALETHGNPVRHVLDEEGGAPCRHCLRAAQPGERVILASHSPFKSKGPYAEIGPIFVHAEACTAYEPQATFPNDFAAKRFVLRKYDREHNNLGGEPVGERSASEVIARIFEDRGVAYLHARFLGSGCYAFRIDRG